VEEWADAAQTINYEIVTRISSRVERLYVGGSWVEAELNELWGTGQEQEG
jgi:alanine racemase